MTASELISDLRMMEPLELRIALQYIADHLPEARLADGSSLMDQTDFKLWLHELVLEVKKAEGLAA